jgi:ABC-type sulfate transport system permease component
MNDMEENEAPASTGKATASMVCGIVSLVGWCVLGPFIVPVALVGLVLGFMSMKSANKGFAITGIITSLISILMGIVVVIFGVAVMGEMEKQGVTFDQIMEEAEQQAEEAEGR